MSTLIFFALIIGVYIGIILALRLLIVLIGAMVIGLIYMAGMPTEESAKPKLFDAVVVHIILWFAAYQITSWLLI